ncbi:transposable element Tc1 transposase [Trichonephila clavipes]|nr:transposable element Tc1 transposase [Trichonephila clavipes]
MTEKCLAEAIRAHYEQLSEFKRYRIIELKEAAWNQADWGFIVFSDESRFHLCPDDHRRRVWRRPGQRADYAFTIACHTGPQQGVMVWDAIFFSRIPLVVIGRHLQHIVRSPYPSPIEHIWDMRGRRLHLPRNVDNLARQLKQIWQEIPQETIRVLYHSMSRRVAACIQARGGSSPY